MPTVKFAPYSSEEIKQNGPSNTCVTAVHRSERNKSDVRIDGVMGYNAFGITDAILESKDRNYYVDHLRSYIPLAVPIVNTAAVASHPNSTLIKLFGVHDDITYNDIKDIRKVLKILPNGEEVYILRNDLVAGDKYLANGQIIRYWISKWNKIDRCCEVLKAELLDKFYTSSTSPNVIEVEYVSSGGNILNNFNLTIHEPPNKKDVREEDIYTHICDVYMRDTSNAFVYCWRTEKENLNALVIDTVAAIPIGLRPSIDGRDDPITLNYNNLVKESLSIETVNPKTNPLEFLSRYIRLQQYYELFASASATQKKDIARKINYPKAVNRKSIIEQTASKKGQMRRHNLSKVQDYSGRSVIVADPTISVREVAVPTESIKKMLEYHTTTAAIGQEGWKNVVDDTSVLFNRAPTLHKLSTRSYKMVPSKYNAIGTHPLVNDGYNADHDGDQMGIHVPLDRDAITEYDVLLGLTNNMYIPSSGNVTLTPKQDMLYGLNVLSADDARMKALIPEGFSQQTCKADSLDELKDMFLEQECAVWDIATVAGKTATVGRHLITYIFPQVILDAKDSNGNDLATNITKSNIKPIMSLLCGSNYSSSYQENEDYIVQCLDRLTEISFAAATLYPASLSIFLHPETTEAAEMIDHPFQNFIDNVVPELQEPYTWGLESKSAYNTKYSEICNTIEEKLTKNIDTIIGFDNGFVRIMQCGARGNNSNLAQMFAYKGRIARTATEAFDTVITSCYLNQLNDLEHFFVAHGTRKSLLDKTRKPADTGYATRRMAYVAANAVIASHDCGTTDGININFRKFHTFAETRDNGVDVAQKMLAAYITGRFPSENATLSDGKDSISLNTDNIIDKQQAEKIATIMLNDYENKRDEQSMLKSIKAALESYKSYTSISNMNAFLSNAIYCADILGLSNIDISVLKEYVKERYTLDLRTKVRRDAECVQIVDAHIKETDLSEYEYINFKVRSPIYCKDPYCAKCYGINWATHRLPIIGTPIGALASTSLGEPGTQLSMRTFQKGGVASKGDITSDFDKINDVINCKAVKQGEDPFWDPVAWDTGEVICHPIENGKYTEVTIIPEDKSITPRTMRYKGNVKLRPYCYVGEGLSEIQGNLDVKEIVQKSSLQKAQEYVSMSVFNIYFTEVGIYPIHCEVLAAESGRVIVADTDGSAYIRLPADDKYSHGYDGDTKGETLYLKTGMILTNREYSQVVNKQNCKFIFNYYGTKEAPLLGENVLSSLSYMKFKTVMETALLFGKVDPMTSTFSNLMMGLPPRVGTRYNPNYVLDTIDSYGDPALIL